MVKKLGQRLLAFLCICVFVCTDSCADCLQFYEFYDDWCDSWFFTGALCHIIYREGTAPYDWRNASFSGYGCFFCPLFLEPLVQSVPLTPGKKTRAVHQFFESDSNCQCGNVVTGFSICVLMIVLFGVDKDTYLPLLVGQTVLCAPFAYLSVLPKLKQMDPEFI